jgi:hypothetical protein
MNKKAEGKATDEDDTIVLDDESGIDNDEDNGEKGNLGADNSSDEQGSEGDGNDEGEDGSVVVTIGEESPPTEDDQSHAPEWVRELRKANREDKKRIRELEEQLRATKGEDGKKPVTLGPKPTLEGHDYDAEKYEEALASWYDQKRVVEEQKAKAKAEAEAQEKEWQSKLESYGKAKASLKVKDFEDAEVTVQELLSSTQQGIILQGAENSALVIYALGKNLAKLKELAAITDPVKYAFAVSKLETQLKVTQRKAPPPERTVRGTGSMSGATDSTLERLRTEAEKTGDYTKVVQYRKQLKAKKT